MDRGADDNSGSREATSRRALLRSGGLGVMLAGAGLAATPSSLLAAGSPKSGGVADVVVVGAGFSGLAAARQL
ncbi:MAG: hypothetical protein J7499_03540, partial [Sphingopyxis sp.]|nr:hypothetical protein [Sphingopyxis sp.]